MESGDYTVRPRAHINLLVGHRYFAQWSGLSRKDPSRCRAGFAARLWHTRPANRKAATLRARNPKAMNQRGGNRKATNPKAENLRVMTLRGGNQRARNPKGAIRRAMTQKVTNQT